jgi:adenosylhomocysteine nucleosidase
MNGPVAIIAALPREVAPLVKGWKEERLSGNRTIYLRKDAVVACAGMGPSQAALAVSAARALLPVTELISTGLAGACDPALPVGAIVRPSVIVDRNTGERFLDHLVDDRAEYRFEQLLISTTAIISVAEKQKLRLAYDAAAVDMEAATVARLARAHGVRFRAIKAISDAADFDMSGLSRFSTEEGQFRERAFAMHAALRPWMWASILALAKNSGKAVNALNEALRAELD